MLLQELGRRLHDGRVYDRHLPELASALSAVLAATADVSMSGTKASGDDSLGVASLRPGGLEVTSLVKITAALSGPG